MSNVIVINPFMQGGGEAPRLAFDITGTTARARTYADNTVLHRIGAAGQTTSIAGDLLSTGKWYFEIEQIADSSAVITLGIAAAPKNFALGYDSSSKSIGSVTNFRSAPLRYGIAVDFDAQRGWFHNNGVWSGSPVDGTGGVSFLNDQPRAAGVQLNDPLSNALVALAVPPYVYQPASYEPWPAIA